MKQDSFNNVVPYQVQVHFVEVVAVVSVGQAGEEGWRAEMPSRFRRFGKVRVELIKSNWFELNSL